MICLTSALVFHEITTQVPSTISLAIPRGTRQPVVDYPPIEFYLFGEDSFDMGIEIHPIADAKVKVYSPEKTVAVGKEKDQHRLIFLNMPGPVVSKE